MSQGQLRDVTDSLKLRCRSSGEAHNAAGLHTIAVALVDLLQR